MESKLNDLLWILTSQENMTEAYYSRKEMERAQLRDFFWFMAYRDELAEKHHGKYALIRNRELAGLYDTYEEAFKETERKGWKAGTFTIQLCTDSEEEETQATLRDIQAWRDRHIRRV